MPRPASPAAARPLVMPPSRPASRSRLALDTSLDLEDGLAMPLHSSSRLTPLRRPSRHREAIDDANRSAMSLDLEIIHKKPSTTALDLGLFNLGPSPSPVSLSDGASKGFAGSSETLGADGPFSKTSRVNRPSLPGALPPLRGLKVAGACAGKLPGHKKSGLTSSFVWDGGPVGTPSEWSGRQLVHVRY